MLHRRGPFGPGEGYLLCEKVNDAVDLVRAVELLRNSKKRKRAIETLARLLCTNELPVGFGFNSLAG